MYRNQLDVTLNAPVLKKRKTLDTVEYIFTEVNYSSETY